MKKAIIITLLAIAAITGASCRGNSNTIPDSEPTISADSVNALAPYDMTDTVTVRGTKYAYHYAFHTDQSLPIVTNSFGYRYYDNIVELTITKGAETVFQHTFTKESFKNHIPEDDITAYALLGFNFNYMKIDDHSQFHFIASVGDCDESCAASYPIAIDITQQGAITLTLATDIETGPQFDMTYDPNADEGV